MVRIGTKIALLLKFQVCWLIKLRQILSSNADFETEPAFLHSLGRSLPVDQRIETTFLSRFSWIADTDRLPVAASWMCSLHQAIIGRLRSM